MNKEEILAEYEKDKLAAYEAFKKETATAEKAWKDAVEAAWEDYKKRFLEPLWGMYECACSPAKGRYESALLAAAYKRDEALKIS
jgi:hypothetical protein